MSLQKTNEIDDKMVVEEVAEQTNTNEHSLSSLEETARIQQKVEHELTKWELIREYPMVCAWMMSILWVMILVGYDGQASGMVLNIPQFRQDFGHSFEDEYVLEGNWQSAISGGPTASMAAGTLLGSYLGDKYGRKWILALSVLLTIPFVAIEYISTTIEVFFAGKFLCAFCLGIMVSVGTTYIGEVTPLALRAVASSCVNLSQCIGPFICFLINNTTSTYTTRMAYRSIFIPQWIFAITSLMFLPFLLESPYWLVMNGQDEKALKSLKKLYRGEVQPQQQFAIVKITYMEAQAAAKTEGTYLDLFRKANIKRTFVAMMGFFMQPFSGVSFISSYSTYYYQLSGFSTKQSYQISCGAQLLSVSGVIASWFITDRFGRRAVMMYAMGSLFVLNIITAGLGTDTSNQSMLTGASLFMCMYNFFYNSGIGPLSYVIATENPTSTLRAKTISISIIVNFAFQCMWGFVLPYMFNPDQANMGSKINFIFGGCSFVALIFFFFYLPETGGRSYEEIDEMYYNNVPPRKFKHHVCELSVKSEAAYNNDQKIEKSEHIEDAEEEYDV